MLQESYPYFLANTAVSTNQHLAVHDKFTGEVATQVALADAEAIDQAVLSSFRDFDSALDEVNNSDFGLQAGIFTRDIYKIQKAWDELDVGGVVIGDVPSWRVDHMPYGGVKDSGLGREGVRYAIEDMTELRLLVIRDPH